MTIALTLTTAGLAALVNATNTGTRASAIAAIGVSPTAITPTADMTALPGELKRITAIGGTIVDAQTIHIAMEDNSTDAYTLSSFAIYLADGTLFALYGQPTPILVKTAASIGMLAIDVVLTDAGASADAITIAGSGFTNPPASTTVVGVTRYATATEAQNGNSNKTALTPLAAAGAVLKWLLAVDGAGSNLDADLLDGQQGAWYADIPARLGFTPLAATAFTPAAILAKLLSVDGAGSGLDADLLDGQQGAWYADIAARLGYTPLNAATFTAANILAALKTVDGSGSGLDADLLDGQHASAFARMSDFASTQGQQGSQNLPGGLVIKWAKVGPFSGEGLLNVAFNEPFPNACFNVQVSLINTNGGNAAQDQGVQVYNPTKDGVGVYSQIYGGGSSTFPAYAYLMAIGN